MSASLIQHDGRHGAALAAFKVSCPNCGFWLDRDAPYCIDCGTVRAAVAPVEKSPEQAKTARLLGLPPLAVAAIAVAVVLGATYFPFITVVLMFIAGIVTTRARQRIKAMRQQAAERAVNDLRVLSFREEEERLETRIGEIDAQAHEISTHLKSDALEKEDRDAINEGAARLRRQKAHARSQLNEIAFVRWQNAVEYCLAQTGLLDEEFTGDIGKLVNALGSLVRDGRSIAAFWDRGGECYSVARARAEYLPRIKRLTEALQTMEKRLRRLAALRSLKRIKSGREAAPNVSVLAHENRVGSEHVAETVEALTSVDFLSEKMALERLRLRGLDELEGVEEGDGGEDVEEVSTLPQ